MERTASELRTRMVKLKTRGKEETEYTKTGRIYNPNGYLSKIDSKGIIYSKLMIFSTLQVLFPSGIQIPVFWEILLFCRLL